MTKMYTLEELFTKNVITNSPQDFLKDEKNIPDFYKEVFDRIADGSAIEEVKKLSADEFKKYNSDIKSIIFNPDLLKYIWNFRLEAINNSSLNEETIQKYISEIYQYIEVYMRQKLLYERYINGETNVKPDYEFKPDWPVKAQNAITKINMDLNNLYLQGKLPKFLLLSTDNKGLGILTNGFGHNCEEVDVTDALNRIGINVNAEDLISSRFR